MTALGAVSPAPSSHPFPLTPLLPHLCPHDACCRHAGGRPDAPCRWQSREMLKRYGASAATERALAASARMSPGDRL